MTNRVKGIIKTMKLKYPATNRTKLTNYWNELRDEILNNNQVNEEYNNRVDTPLGWLSNENVDWLLGNDKTKYPEAFEPKLPYMVWDNSGARYQEFRLIESNFKQLSAWLKQVNKIVGGLSMDQKISMIRIGRHGGVRFTMIEENKKQDNLKKF